MRRAAAPQASSSAKADMCYKRKANRSKANTRIKWKRTYGDKAARTSICQSRERDTDKGSKVRASACISESIPDSLAWQKVKLKDSDWTSACTTNEAGMRAQHARTHAHTHAHTRTAKSQSPHLNAEHHTHKLSEASICHRIGDRGGAKNAGSSPNCAAAYPSLFFIPFRMSSTP